MVEIGLAIAAGFGIGKIADAEGRSALVWGLITFGLCAASLIIPLPFLRILLAAVLAFIGLMIARARDGR